MLLDLAVHLFSFIFLMTVFWEERNVQCSEKCVPQAGLNSVARGVIDGFIELCKIKTV